MLMQYFVYLHRNPDEGPDHDLTGFNFWPENLTSIVETFTKQKW